MNYVFNYKKSLTTNQKGSDTIEINLIYFLTENFIGPNKILHENFEPPNFFKQKKLFGPKKDSVFKKKLSKFYLHQIFFGH